MSPPILLSVTDIDFDSNGLPSYPSLLTGVPPGLQLEPAIRSRPGQSSGPLSIVLELAAGSSAVFAGADGPYALLDADGAQIADSYWSASRSNDGKRCTLVWSGGGVPATRALRLPCVRGQDVCYLFVGVVEPALDSVRSEGAPPPAIVGTPPGIELTSRNDHLVASVYEPSCVDQADALSYSLDLAFRVQDAQFLQVALEIPQNFEFRPPEAALTTTDQVGVTLQYPDSPLGASCLKPVRRESLSRSIITWQRKVGEAFPPTRFLNFKLAILETSSDEEIPSDEEIAGARESRWLRWRHRVDPMIIQDPYIRP